MLVFYAIPFLCVAAAAVALIAEAREADRRRPYDQERD